VNGVLDAVRRELHPTEDMRQSRIGL
jgi:hypothetical protein